MKQKRNPEFTYKESNPDMFSEQSGIKTGWANLYRIGFMGMSMPVENLIGDLRLERSDKGSLFKELERSDKGSLFKELVEEGVVRDFILYGIMFAIISATVINTYW